MTKRRYPLLAGEVRLDEANAARTVGATFLMWNFTKDMVLRSHRRGRKAVVLDYEDEACAGDYDYGWLLADEVDHGHDLYHEDDSDGDV